MIQCVKTQHHILIQCNMIDILRYKIMIQYDMLQQHMIHYDTKQYNDTVQIVQTI